jgi:hypothetical protein
MFGLIERSKGYLFASEDLRNILESQLQAMRNEVDKLEANRLTHIRPPTLSAVWRLSSMH